jgi:hypothetical protein
MPLWDRAWRFLGGFLARQRDVFLRFGANGRRSKYRASPRLVGRLKGGRKVD